jgi:hypothetical protein
MKLKLAFLTLFYCSVFYSQQANDANFKPEIERIITEAATGFQKSKGELVSSYYHSFTYDCTISMYGSKANIIYGEPYFSGYTHENVASYYFFSQTFSAENSTNGFINQNGERLLDEMADKLDLKKKKVKQDKNHREKDLEYEYFKGKQKLFAIDFNLVNKSVSIKVYSDLKPQDLKKSNYKGCLVLYNMQNNAFVQANTYCVFDENEPNKDVLFGVLLNKITPDFRVFYKKYEWMPFASDEQIYLKLKELNIEQRRQNINATGETIN